MNYRVTVNNYKVDKYYPKVVRVVSEILETKGTVRATDVLKGIGVLAEENYQKWMSGKLVHLESVVECNLSKATRILTILSFHAHDLNLQKSSDYIKFKGRHLRFTKNGTKKVEELYSRQFSVIGKWS